MKPARRCCDLAVAQAVEHDPVVLRTFSNLARAATYSTTRAVSLVAAFAMTAGCAQAHECDTPYEWRACERFCTFSQCQPDGTWGGCVEHGGACDVGITDACAAAPRDAGGDADSCVPFVWRACDRFCTFSQCQPDGTWGPCVEHGGPCDAGPRSGTSP